MSQRQFAVFDIDGTLIRWQLYHAAVERLAKDGFLGKGAYQAIHKARSAWKNREHVDAFRAYELQMIEAYEKALPKLSVADFESIVDDIASKYKTQVYRYTRDLLQRLKKEGYFILAISGSHQELVEHIGQQYGFDDCVGTQFLQSDGRYTGGQVFAAADKRKALKALIKKHDLTLKGSYGVGDSRSDAPMLEMVDNPIAFNPDQNLLKLAQKAGWPIVVERKNVIYQLQKVGSSYRLIES